MTDRVAPSHNDRPPEYHRIFIAVPLAPEIREAVGQARRGASGRSFRRR
jgi:hypothetical protein